MGLIYGYFPSVVALPVGPSSRGMQYSLGLASGFIPRPTPRATQFLTDWGVFWQGGDGAAAVMEVLVDEVPVGSLGPCLGASGFLFATMAVPVAGEKRVEFRLSWVAGMAPIAAFSTSVVVRAAIGQATVARIMGNFPAGGGALLEPGVEDVEWLDSSWNATAPVLAGGVLIPKGGVAVPNIATLIGVGANTLTNTATLSVVGSVSGFLASEAYGAGTDGFKTHVVPAPTVLTPGEFLVVHGSVSPLGLAGVLFGPVHVTSKLLIP